MMSKNSEVAIALLEEHFDIAFAAPDGIKKLRELILSLAMQGKLVAQDPSAQPASELLKEIQAEKERLIKEGKIKKSKPLPEIKPNEVPYDLPKGWEWAKFGEIYSLEYGDNLPTTKRSNTGEFPVYGSNGIVGTHNISFVNSPCIVIGRKGSAGALNLSLTKGCCVTDVAYYSVPPKGIDLFFSFQLFQTLGLDSLGKGIVPGLNREEVYKLIVTIPPLAEQRRIVAKIDELMARCDELERLRGDRDRKQITVHNSALNRLIIAKEQSDINAAWQFITQHFNELYSVKGNITELRKAILQLAVMGKLVPQAPSDQPASELLKEIDAEEERLEGKTKDSYKLVKIDKNEHLFDIPQSWIWTRCENLAKFIDPQPSHRTPPEYQNGVPYIGYSDINHVKGINFSGARKVSPKVLEEHRQRYQLNLGDFVFGKIGTLGQPFFLTEPFDYCLSANLILIQPNLSIVHPKYLAVFLESPSFSDFLNENKTNSTHGVFGIKKARLICLPLPPLAEQHRIVAKIDQLMALCDNLEKQIDAVNSKQTNLLNAVMTKI